MDIAKIIADHVAQLEADKAAALVAAGELQVENDRLASLLQAIAPAARAIVALVDANQAEEVTETAEIAAEPEQEQGARAPRGFTEADYVAAMKLAGEGQNGLFTSRQIGEILGVDGASFRRHWANKIKGVERYELSEISKERRRRIRKLVGGHNTLQVVYAYNEHAGDR